MKKYITNFIIFGILVYGLLYSLYYQKESIPEIFHSSFNIEKKVKSKIKNFSYRKPKMVIMHYTAGDYNKSLSLLTTKEVSAHYLVNIDGDVDQIIPEHRNAWHAGKSSWGNFSSLNDISLGIEVINFGYVDPEREEYITKEEPKELPYYREISKKAIYVENQLNIDRKWFKFSDKQIKKIGEMLQDFKNRYNIPDNLFLGHSDISPQRKNDPGPLFPWQEIYEKYGVGAWYDLSEKLQYVSLPKSDATSRIIWIQKHLKIYGYACEITGELDEETQNVLQAFQMHFRPKIISGDIDDETIDILAHLVDKYIYAR